MYSSPTSTGNGRGDRLASHARRGGRFGRNEKTAQCCAGKTGSINRSIAAGNAVESGAGSCSKRKATDSDGSDAAPLPGGTVIV